MITTICMIVNIICILVDLMIIFDSIHRPCRTDCRTPTTGVRPHHHKHTHIYKE